MQLDWFCLSSNLEVQVPLYNSWMRNSTQLPREFFARPTLEVARDLLGKRLVHLRDGKRLSGLISETEGYISEADLACHARYGRTPRSEILYYPPGHAYIYINYGLHWLLNFVTEQEDFPAAVLIRALFPVEGIEVMRQLRGRPDAILTNGPGKLTQAMGIDGSLNKIDICASDAPLFVENQEPVLDEQVTQGPRVGIDNVPEPWRSKPWRFVWKK